MKHLLIFCNLFFASFSTSYGQSAEKISILVLREDPKVDKLMDNVLGPKAARGIRQSVIDTANCYVIELIKFKNDSYAYQTKKVTKQAANIMINQKMGRLDFGCFEYRKHHFIVWTDTDFSDLIAKTTQTITLNFVSKLETVPSLRPSYIKIWHYLYDKGRFTNEDGPPPMAN